MKAGWLNRTAVAVALTAAVPFAGIAAQQAAESGPKVGEMAPDFILKGATRYGLLKDGVKLSDYRGNVVVLAFFFKARSKG
jgi:thioredoxin-dependent peroxiredoxin